MHVVGGKLHYNDMSLVSPFSEHEEYLAFFPNSVIKYEIITKPQRFEI
jgi:hypothetical protein